MIKYGALLPSQLEKVYDEIVKFLPDSFRSKEAFLSMYLSKSCEFFEIGDFQGVFWFANLVRGWQATVHIVIWDDAARGQVDRARGILHQLMDIYRLKRLTAIIPETLPEAIAYAEKIGFVNEGSHPYGDMYDGLYVTMYDYALFPKEG